MARQKQFRRRTFLIGGLMSGFTAYLATYPILSEGKMNLDGQESGVERRESQNKEKELRGVIRKYGGEFGPITSAKELEYGGI